MGKSDNKSRSTTKATEAGAVSVPGTQNITAPVPAPATQAGAVSMPGASRGQNAKPGLRRRGAADGQEDVASKQVGAVATKSPRGGQNAKPGLRHRSSAEQNEQPAAVASRPDVAVEDTPKAGAVRVLGEPKTKRAMRESRAANTATVAGIDVVDVVDVDNIPAKAPPRAGAIRSNSGRRLGESKVKREMRETRGTAAAAAAAVTVPVGSANRAPASATTYQDDMASLEAKLGTSSGLNLSKSGMAKMEEGLQNESRTSVTYTESVGPERPVDSRRATTSGTIPGGIDDSQLVTARPVDEEELPELPAADAWDQEKEAKAQEERRYKAAKKNRIFMAVGLLVVGAVVLLAVLLTRNSGEDTIVVVNSTSSPTLSPTAAPTWKGNSILELLPDFTKDAILEEGAPQRQAYDWLVGDPAFSSYSNTRLLQRFALATYYYGTGGDMDWSNSQSGRWIINATFGWMEYDVHECDWAFINDTRLGGAVLTLHDGTKVYERTDTPCVVGTPEDASDEERIYEHLWLPKTRLSGIGGTLPPEVYLLTNLKRLWSHANLLSGTISSLVGQLTDLEVFSLSYNQLTGTLPQELANCTNLLALDLTGQGSNVGLTGTLPSFLFEIQTLKHLWLDVQNFTGPIPSEVGILTNLETLYVGENFLDQSIPTEVGLMTSLKELRTYRNALTGPLPSELGILKSLEYIDVGENSHSGSIPSELGVCENLRQLNIPYNSLQGSLPTELGQLGVLEQFWVAENQLTGSIISELGMLTSITGKIELNGNELTGTIPTEIGLLSSMFYLAFSRNRISGTVPTEVGQLTGLLWLWANNNMLTGNIPTELALLPLEELALYVNQLTGSIPEGISELPYLLYFDVAHNELTGEVPSFESVRSGYFVESGWGWKIDVANNTFSGVIPEDLCHLEPDGYLGFDCSDILCGCSCECMNATASTVDTAEATAIGNDTTLGMGTNVTNATNLNV